MLSLNPEVDVREMQALFLLSHALILLSRHECLTDICLIYVFYLTFDRRKDKQKDESLFTSSAVIVRSRSIFFGSLFVLPEVS